jgi:hypothetical protein
VVFFQQIASLGNNITLGIFAGITMKVGGGGGVGVWVVRVGVGEGLEGSD